MLAVRNIAAVLVVGTALSGCYPPPLSTPAEQEPANSMAFDGTYQGSVQLTHVAPMAQRAWCQTDAQTTVRIARGTLTYAQPHPGYPDAPIVTYVATVIVGGSFSGSSDRNGTITGKIAGTHLTGTMEGLGCDYSLVADKI